MLAADPRGVGSLSELGCLFARATVGLEADSHRSGGDLAGRSAIVRLQRIATREVLEAALAACAAADPVGRRVGAAVLGQLGHSEPGFVPVFVEERLAGLMHLIEAERKSSDDPTVLSEACIALGCIHNPAILPALLGLVRHPNAEVRYGVAMGLGGFVEPEAIGGLIELSGDVDEDVRDWATFGLGRQIDTDTAAVRNSLHARLADDCADVRCEAIEGLARRGDRSVLPALDRELRAGVATPLLAAAIALASHELCGALTAAAERGLVWESDGVRHDLTQHWSEALRACACLDDLDRTQLTAI